MKTGKSSKSSRLYLLWGALSMFLCLAVIGAAAWTAFNTPVFASVLNPQPAAVSAQEEILWAQVEIAKPALAPVGAGILNVQPIDLPAPALEPSPFPSLTPAPTDTPTEAPTSTPEPTETPAPLSMEILADTPTPQYVPPTLSPQKPSVASAGNGVRWIDVDLTRQMVFAYEGDVVVNSFVVSTGTWRTPTVTGQYKIYVKIRSARMSGPGYSLPNVPYIMYFYKGYGLHGTYWHNNFGTPMSHGCVNLRTEDAEWLFNWASVGTLVNIHY
ncbi:MAG: L,D-transpeptidase family protein [Chloroflexota bacterium]